MFFNYKNITNMIKERKNSSGVDGLREVAVNSDGSPKDNDLGYVLERIFPNKDWIHNKIVKDASGNNITIPGQTSMRPDFRCDDLHLIVELDGAGGRFPQHFTNDEKAKKDQAKVEALENAGYKVVSIPPYVQMDVDMIEFYFGNQAQKEENLYSVVSEHGFLHPQITLPAAYSELGLKRFENDMRNLPIKVRRKIIDSLWVRINEFAEKLPLDEAKKKVLPERLFYLLEQ